MPPMKQSLSPRTGTAFARQGWTPEQVRGDNRGGGGARRRFQARRIRYPAARFLRVWKPCQPIQRAAAAMAGV